MAAPVFITGFIVGSAMLKFGYNYFFPTPTPATDSEVEKASALLAQISINEPTNLDKLIIEIKNQNLEGASAYIATMSTEELNGVDRSSSTALYCALYHSFEISRLILDKFLKSNSTPNCNNPDGISIFSDEKDGARLLGTVTHCFRKYACADARNFRDNIHEDANSEEILSRRPKPAAEAEAAEAAQIQPVAGRFTRKSISRCAKLVDRAQAGACTSLALAAAHRLLKLFPEERIEIYAHNGGMGSHVFVVVNHSGNEWSYNHSDNQEILDDKPRRDALRDRICQEHENSFIVDPWLASLGWDNGIFTFPQYLTNHSGFLFNAHRYFDNKEENLNK